MDIGAQLRQFRKAKELSQGDNQRPSGLKRTYVFRLEHGHTPPSVGTLEKLAAALGVPLYRLFYSGKARPKLPKVADENRVGDANESPFLKKFRLLIGRIDESDRRLLLHLAPEDGEIVAFTVDTSRKNVYLCVNNRLGTYVTNAERR